MKYNKYIIRAFLICISLFSFFACDEHEYIEPYSVGNSVLCQDGQILDTTSCRMLGATPIAVIFHTTGDSIYAVWIRETSPSAFSDHPTGIQNTSMSIIANDGFTNTSHLLQNDSIKSPIAESIVGIFPSGQSAFIPSVNEMNYLQSRSSSVNQVLQWCTDNYPSLGVNLLPMNNDESDCWYWTSTEVNSGNAYLYSVRRCYSELSTPKSQLHKVRPIVIVRK